MLTKSVLQDFAEVEKRRMSRIETCPHCNTKTVFTHTGEQHWSPEIARARGIPEVVSIWNCTNCYTNVNDVQFSKHKKKR